MSDELIKRLESGEGLDREIDAALWAISEPQAMAISKHSIPKYTESLDAAVALVEKMHPNWDWYVRNAHSADGDVKYANAQIWRPCDPRDDEAPRYWANHDRPMRALLIALLRSMEDT